MKRRSNLSAIGGYQPFLFCIGMYFVALFFSIFICSAIFYAVNPKKPVTGSTAIAADKSVPESTSQQMLLTVTNK